MAKIKYLGGKETGNTGSVEWGEHKFELNKFVECKDPHIVRKARNNRFFEVADDDIGDVAIPKDWEKLGPKEKVDLAKKLAGGEGITTGKEAEALIAAELERRRADTRKEQKAV